MSKMNNIYKLTLEETYCKEWTVQDAIRELLQNAIDTHTDIEVTPDKFDSKLWIIRDSGQGMKLGDFLIGRTSKSDDNTTIGQFGEGASLACLVLAREGRFIDICSGGYRYDIQFSRDEDWDATLLTFTTSELPIPVSGTIIRLEATEDEIESAKQLFIYFNPQEILHTEAINGNPVELLACKGDIYVNGLKVSSIKSLYGYNFYNHKALMNRDRNLVGYEQINSAIEQVLETTDNPVLIKELLAKGTCLTTKKIDDAISDLVEFRTYFIPARLSGNIKTWEECLEHLYGDNLCLESSPHFDLLAIDSDWTVIKAGAGLTFGLKQLLKSSNQVELHPNIPVEYKDLSEIDRKILDESKAIVLEFADILGITLFPVTLFKSVSSIDSTQGEFKNGHVAINISLIHEHNVQKLVGTLIHESIHGTHNVLDLSRAFEDVLSNMIAKLVMLLKAKGE